jgi:hypothetical protein
LIFSPGFIKSLTIQFMCVPLHLHIHRKKYCNSHTNAAWNQTPLKS